MKRFLPFALGMLTAAAAYAETPLHEWDYHKDGDAIALQASQPDGALISGVCLKGQADSAQECAVRIERALLTPAVYCVLKDAKISCKIP